MALWIVAISSATFSISESVNAQVYGVAYNRTPKLLHFFEEFIRG